MKAIRVHEFGGPERLVLDQVPDLRPEDGQVVVKIHAAGVNPVETYIRSGVYALKPALPYTPGGDGAGVVMSVGKGVSRVRAGDRVYVAGSVSGTYAEQALCLESRVHPLPEKITFAQGAAVGVPYATAYRAMFQVGKAQAGETVLVHGASGGVGIAALQLGRAAGQIMIGTAGTQRGSDLVRQQGAHHVLDHNAPDMAQQLAKLTGGRGVDVILEMLANKNLGKDLTMVAARGRVVVVGSRGTVEINPRDIMSRHAEVLGMILFGASEQELAGVHRAVIAALESGVARPIVGQEIPLAEAARAHIAVLEPGAYGKIVLIP